VSAPLSANAEMFLLYWDIGRMIALSLSANGATKGSLGQRPRNPARPISQALKGNAVKHFMRLGFAAIFSVFLAVQWSSF